MASGTSREVLGRGLSVLGRAIREQPRIFAVAVSGSVLFGLMVVASAFVVGGVVGDVVVPSVETGSVGRGALALAAALLLGLSVMRVVGIVGRRLGAGYMQFRLQAAYRRRVTRRYLELPLSWHQRNATGTLLSNANSDVEAAWNPIAPLPFAVGTLVMLVGAVVSLLAVDWALALVGLAVFPALFALNVAYSRRMAPRQARAQRLRAEVSGIAHESFDGALVVKTMGREAQETARFASRAGELRDALISVGRLRGIFDPMLETLPSLGTLAVLVVGAYRLRQGAIEVSDLVSVAFLFTVLAFPVRAIGWVLAELPRSVAGWDRVRRVLDATGEMPYGDTRLDPAGGPATLTFTDVGFAYEPAEAHLPGAEVLGEVTFTVGAGKIVALVGPTGAGKSTIATLAVRLVDPRSGTVSLDGVDVRELAADSLAGTAALVAQVPFVFDDTVRANVSLDRPGVDDEAVWAALRLAEADGFVAALPDGLDTMVGERGTSLSGGQRQRLTLARALAGRPRLLVLDDATSAVDPRVEAAILAGLRSSATGGPAASILVVAYRRATIALADEVIYLEQGRVVARGTHATLLATVPGYTDLVTAYEQAEVDPERQRAYDEVTPLTSALEVDR
ncbi:ABC-type multidrug transport system, ATPase and permease component [Micromonospora phaseoli]|uniref:ABC-type multidrug transport system, ATPase and permease component n=1 Tax=Micromonospora phaseoli TaxID=1144548 RepID=A0A1H7D413_9ACTN|nr:ABC transporter ATP-binding protein [Micromonospora phaseoli]PZV98151.1 ABC-type multidrug transport system fused ATPase/permease subunit [Micromonospora phaseoli]GIJ77738.1 multidrug ABC transporter ATP-binding protein [Micromonospora phaseoli]SEJ96114.1 ABC-type multidrug transport system, ATPase and permease component [Micromonospora phaseoli]